MISEKVTVAFMTNYSLSIPEVEIPRETIQSFYETLKIDGRLKTHIFCDSKPLSEIGAPVTLYNGSTSGDHLETGRVYLERLSSIDQFRDCPIVMTRGLVDGYLKAIELCQTPFLFFLEHDWSFSEEIGHSLLELCEWMDSDPKINCILFNKKNNSPCLGQEKVEPHPSLPLCLTNRQSNNPNLLRVSNAKKWRMPLLKAPGCKVHPGLLFFYNFCGQTRIPHYCGGIECELTQFASRDPNHVALLGTYLYGRTGQGPTVNHLDGCDRKRLNRESVIIR
jgi:hypothetical protein